jgi:hypothetical protein
MSVQSPPPPRWAGNPQPESTTSSVAPVLSRCRSRCCCCGCPAAHGSLRTAPVVLVSAGVAPHVPRSSGSPSPPDPQTRSAAAWREHGIALEAHLAVGGADVVPARCFEVRCHRQSAPTVPLTKPTRQWPHAGITALAGGVVRQSVHAPRFDVAVPRSGS